METIALGCDHGAFILKEGVKKYLQDKGYNVVDFGCNSLDSVDYPLFARPAALYVKDHPGSKGIVLCTTGEGVMMVCNKVKGIRCGLVHNEDTANQIVSHNNANMMSLGAKYTTLAMAEKYIDIFLSSKFEGGRHALRVSLIEQE